MNETFGDRLLRLRKEHDLTMDEFAEAFRKKFPELSLDKPMISRYENNKNTPKRFTLVEAIAEFFGVSIEYLMGRSDSPTGEDNPYKRIPILGTIAAGVPILAQEYILGYESIPRDLSADFCLRVKGDSMINARILDGDLVYIRHQPDIEHGEIAAVLIDQEEATLKRVYKNNGTLVLHPENPNYKDLVFTTKDIKQVTILGKAILFKSEVR